MRKNKITKSILYVIYNMNEGKFVNDEIVNKLIEKIIFDSEKKDN